MAVVAHHPLTDCQAVPRSQTSSARLGDRIRRTLRLWRSRSRERHAFDYVDDRALRDLAVSRWEFDRELGKPFWRG